MSEYITREEALESVREKLMICDALPDTIAKDASVFTLASMQHSLESIPAADVRPVVLCKDCVYLSHDKYGAWCFNNYEANLKDDDFCSHGKRKEKQT